MEIKKLDDNKLVKATTKKRRIKMGAIVLAVLIIGAAVGCLVTSHLTTEAKTTKIGFEDIGELDTQVAYCTVVDVIDDPREIFGVEVPFTKSKYIYSYDVVVKAGLDFEKMDWKETGGKIKVKMPEVYVTDSYIDEKSGRIYHEEESIFSPITLEEQILARAELVETGVNDAIANGLYDKAKENAEKMLTSFFKQHDEYKDKEIIFEWK